MSPASRRFAICLSLAAAAHAGLLAAVTRAGLNPRTTADSVITVTLGTGAAAEAVDRRVLASHAQTGQARRSQRRRRRHIGAGQRAPSTGRLHARATAPEHVQRLSHAGRQRPAADNRYHAAARTGRANPSRPKLTRAARGDPRAAYLSHWRRRVEQYGNRHYPGHLIAAAPRHRLTLVVTLRADGSLQSVRVRKSSGSAGLDGAARAIVRNAGPYAPFPKPLRNRYKHLTFAYEWVFGD